MAVLALVPVSRAMKVGGNSWASIDMALVRPVDVETPMRLSRLASVVAVMGQPDIVPGRSQCVSSEVENCRLPTCQAGAEITVIM